MNWFEIIKFGISTLIAGSGISVVLIFIFREVVKKSFDMGIERYKMKLNKEIETHKSSLSIEVEKFKSAMDIKSMEHQIKYVKLHEERGTVIKEIYNKLYLLKHSLEKLTKITQGRDWMHDSENSEYAISFATDLEYVIGINRIYFSQELCSKMDSIYSKSIEVIKEFNHAKKLEIRNEKLLRSGEKPKGNQNETINLWNNANSKVKTEISNICMELENLFREIIGI
jgi:hypothetical protein